MKGIFHFCAIALLALFTCSSCQNKSQNASIDDEYDNRSYIFFLSAKVGSNEYAHDIVAFEISGDSLRYLYNYKID